MNIKIEDLLFYRNKCCLELNIDHIVIQIKPIDTTQTDPKIWWQMQSTEPFTQKPAGCFQILSRFLGNFR